MATLYKKVGRRYVPCAEYDNEVFESFPAGAHLVMCYPGGQSRRFHIQPNHAAMIAAGRVAEDAICKAMAHADQVRPPRRALTPEEHAAWQNLIEVWGDEARCLSRASHYDVARAAVDAMCREAEKLMQHESVRQAYQQFLLVCELAKTPRSG